MSGADVFLFHAEDPFELRLYQGSPVWPFRDERERGVLQARAELFGARCTIVDRSSCDVATADPTGREIVGALGEQYSCAARLYAHLTGRGWTTLDGIAALPEAENVVVVVGALEQFNIDDYDAVHEYSCRHALLGIIASTEEGSLAEHVTAGALAATLSSRPDLPGLPARVISSLDGLQIAQRLFTGETLSINAETSSVASALRRPSSVLAVSAHSDGVDLKLSRNAVLCSQISTSRPTVPDFGRPANCQVTGYCHRRAKARGEAFESGELLSADTIATRLLITYSCYFVLGADSAVSPRAGLQWQVLRNGSIGGVLATWMMGAGHPVDVFFFLEPLLRGETIASAFRNFNRSSLGGAAGTMKFVLFGDPASRCVPPRAVERPDPTEPIARRLSARRGSFVPPADQISAMSSWFEDMLPRYARSNVSGDLIRSAATALNAFASAGLDRRAVYRACLDVLLAAEPSVFLQWPWAMPYHCRARSNIKTTCFTCGSNGSVLEVESGPLVRLLASCTQCNNNYADVPASSELLHAEFGAAPSLWTTLPHLPNQVLAVNLRSSREVRRTWFVDDGFELPELAPGRSWLWLYSLSDEGLHVYARMLRNAPGASSDPPAHPRRELVARAEAARA